jgi:hypothetical protein
LYKKEGREGAGGGRIEIRKTIKREVHLKQAELKKEKIKPNL